MADFVDRLVARLREGEGLSRNRHFQSLSSPEGKRALRIHRHLRSIERDLSYGAIVQVDREAQRVSLTLRMPGGTRTAFVTLNEFRILCSNPIVRAALGGADEST